MTFLEIVRRIKMESGRSGADSGLSPTTVESATGDDRRMVQWANQAWTDLQNMPRHWRWMRQSSTVAWPVATLSRSAALLGLTDWSYWHRASEEYSPSAYLTSAPEMEWMLKWIEYDRFRANFMVGQHAAGSPQFWSIAPDGSLLVGPTSDAAYTIRIDYFKAPTALTLSADVPNMPARFHMILVWRALSQCAGFDAAPEVLGRAESNAEPLMAALISDQAEPMRFGFNRL